MTRRSTRAARSLAVAASISAAILACAFACAPILGIEDVGYGPPPPDAGAGDGTTQDREGGDGDAGIRCDAGTIPCGMICVDDVEDPKNCGGCGIDCGRASCKGRRCEAEILAAGLASPHGISVDDEYVYATLYGLGWAGGASNGAVIRIPIDGGVPDGGSPEVLASGLTIPSFIAARRGYLVWTSANGLTSSLTDGGAMVSNPDAGPLFGLTASDDAAYAINFTGPPCAIHESPIPPGSRPTPPALTVPCGRWVERAGETFFATGRDSEDAGISVVARDGGGGAVQKIGRSRAWALTVSDDEVFYSELGGTRVRRVQRDGGGEVTLAEDLSEPRLVIVDRPSGSIFVGEHGGARIVRIPIGGGPPVPVATGITQLMGLELRKGFLYFAGLGGPDTSSIGVIGRVGVR